MGQFVLAILIFSVPFIAVQWFIRAAPFEAREAVVLLGAYCLAFSGFFLIPALIEDSFSNREEWPTADIIPIRMEVVPEFRSVGHYPAEEVIFTYDYFVGEERYRSQGFSPSGNLRMPGIESLDEDFLGTQKVYYNPENPSESYLYLNSEMPKSTWPYFFLAAIGLALLTWCANAGLLPSKPSDQDTINRTLPRWLGSSRLLLALAWGLLCIYMLGFALMQIPPPFEKDPNYSAYNVVHENEGDSTKTYHLAISPYTIEPLDGFYLQNLMERSWARTFLEDHIYLDNNTRIPIKRKVWKFYSHPRHMKIKSLPEDTKPSVIFEWTEAEGLKRIDSTNPNSPRRNK